jgi:hypothetical protein
MTTVTQQTGVPRMQTATDEVARTTLRSLLLTLACVPQGSRGSSSWTIAKDVSSTLRLSAQANTSITLTGSVKFETKEKTFSVGGSTTFTQMNSTQVANALTLSRTTTQQITTPAPGIVGNTVFIGLLRPQLQLEGDVSRLRFRFLKADDTFALTASDLQNDPQVRQLFDPPTITSFLGQYPLLADPTGATLVKPRYKLRLSILLSPGVTDIFTFKTANGRTFSESKTSTTSVEILETTGFKAGPLQLTFASGQRIQVSQTAVQETSTNKMISVVTTLNRDALGVFEVFADKALGTLVIRDAGPPTPSGQPVVQGKITDAQGAAIGRALVSLRADHADYAALTDADGQYTISTARGTPLPAGTYPVTCGNVSQMVSISSGVTRVNLRSVNGAAALERAFDESGLDA